MKNETLFEAYKMIGTVEAKLVTASFCNKISQDLDSDFTMSQEGLTEILHLLIQAKTKMIESES